jgi:hypothetical protein
LTATSLSGPSNMRLTCHLGICGCDNVLVKVGEDTSHYINGKCIVFDDSYVHEVFRFFTGALQFCSRNPQVIHKGNQRRITLMLDMWNPDMTKLEKEVWMEVMANTVRDNIPRNIFFHSMNLYDIRQVHLEF